METIKNFFNDYATLYGDKVMFGTYNGDQYTFSQLKERVKEMQSMLYYYGVRKGDKVAVLMHDSPRWMTSFFSVTTMGAILVPLTNKSYSSLTVISEALDCRYLILEKNILSEKSLNDLKNDTHLTVIDSDSFECVVSPNIVVDRRQFTYGNTSLTMPQVNIEPHELAVQCVVYDGYAMATESFSNEELLNLAYSNAEINNSDINDDDVYMSLLPLSMMDKKFSSALIPIIKGCKTVFVRQSIGFNLIIKAIDEIKPSVLITAPRFVEMVYNSSIVNVKSRQIADIRPNMRKIFSSLSLRKQGGKIYKLLGGSIRYCLIDDNYSDKVARFIDATGLSSKMKFVCY